MSKIKQVIVMRKDLNMRKGKMCAQASHASMLFLIKQSKPSVWSPEDNLIAWLSPEQMEWTYNGKFTKVCVGAESEQELLDVEKAAKDAGLTVHRVEDEGLTEFNGVKTLTCIAIGPHEADKIDPITETLKLL